MDKLQQQLFDANNRLKESNAGIVIYQRGQCLSLRGTIPNKNSSGKKQHYISLGIYANAAGIQVAEKKAQKLASQLALNEFCWQEWSDNNTKVGTVGDWLLKFEADYFNRKPRNEKTECSFKNEYADMFKRIECKDQLSEEILLELIFTTEPDTRHRQRAVVAANSLAKFANKDWEFNRYKGNYSHIKGDRILPTDEEIIRYYQSIKNPQWQRVFGLMAAYGVSNHEVFHCDLNSLVKPPGHLVSTYRKNHYGTRRIWCLYPEWYQQWELYQPIALPKISGTNKELGHRVSTQFKRYGLCKPGDLRHCWAIRAMGFLPDAMAARMMAHTTAEHNNTYKRWINENQEDKFYKLLMQRSDRPKAPGSQ